MLYLLVISLISLNIYGCSNAGSEVSASTTVSNDSEESDVYFDLTENNDVDKAETIFINLIGENLKESTVSVKINNKENKEKITDYTNLLEIDSETFDYVTNDDGTITWNCAGKDIVYQGTSQKELPIEVLVDYELDGEKIEAEDIKNVSGHFLMRFSYINNTGKEVEIDGKKVSIWQPYAVISGTVFNPSQVSNLTVTNGEIYNSNDSLLAAGLAMPMLEDSLGLSTLDVDVEEVPDTVEIEADVDGYSLSTIISVASTTALDEIEMASIETEEEFDEYLGMGALGDLEDNVRDFDSGTTEINDGMEELNDGMEEVDEGFSEFRSGMDDLADGASSLDDGSSDLYKGMGQFEDNMKQFNSGVQLIQDSISGNANNISQLLEALESVRNSLKSNDLDSPGIYEIISQLATGADTIANAANQISNTCNELNRSYDEVLTMTDTIYQNMASDDGMAQTALCTMINGLNSAYEDIINELYGEDENVYQLLNNIDSNYKTILEIPNNLENVALDLENEQAELTAVAEYSDSANASLQELMESNLFDGLEAETKESIISKLSEIKENVDNGKEKVDSIIENNANQIEVVRSDKDLISTGSENNISEYVAQAKGILDELKKDSDNTTDSDDDDQTDTLEADDDGNQTEDPTQDDEKEVGSIVKINVIKDNLNAFSDELLQFAQTYIKTDDRDEPGLYEYLLVFQEINGGISNAIKSDDTSSIGRYGIFEATKKLGKNISKTGDAVSEISNDQNMGSVIDAVSSFGDANNQLVDGIDELSSGSAQLLAAASRLTEGAYSVKKGAIELKDGVNELSEGEEELGDGVKELLKGINELMDGTSELSEGVKEIINKLDNKKSVWKRLVKIKEYLGEQEAYGGSISGMTFEDRFIIRMDP